MPRTGFLISRIHCVHESASNAFMDVDAGPGLEITRPSTRLSTSGSVLEMQSTPCWRNISHSGEVELGGYVKMPIIMNLVETKQHLKTFQYKEIQNKTPQKSYLSGMTTIAQLTFIPLYTDHPKEKVEELLEFFAQEDVEVEIGYLSTTIKGDKETVFALIKEAYDTMGAQEEQFRFHIELLSPIA